MCLKLIKAGPVILLCLVCSVVILTGCASTDEMGRLQYDLIQLKSDVKDLQTRVPGQGINELKKLEEQQNATNKAVSDLFIKTQDLSSDLQVLTGRFEESRYFSEKSSKELSANKDSLSAQLKALESAVNDLNKRLAVLEPKKKSAKQQKPAEKSKKAAPSKDNDTADKKEVKDIYMDAYKTFKGNKFSEARKGFKALLSAYPKSEYSDNARFWIGETYYKEENYEEAILAYQELLDKNPDSDKVPGALLKQGMAFYELNDNVTGKIILDKLIEKFADSEQAKIAKKKLRPLTPPKKKQ